MKKTIFPLFSGVVVAMLLAGCSQFASKKTGAKPAKGSLYSLQEENQALQAKLRKTEAKLNRLTEVLEKEQKHNARFREMMATNFELLEQSIAISLEKSLNSPIRPQASKKKPAFKMPAATVKKTGAETFKLPGIRAQVPLPSAAKVTKIQKPFEDPDLEPPLKPRTLSAYRPAKSLYQKGFSYFANQDYEQAILVFRDFLLRFPQDIYSDNAQFWIGESHFSLGRWEEAESAYREVLRTYEHRSSLEGYKTPEAIYRLGGLALQKKDLKKAHYYFSAVAQRYPDTSTGKKASKEVRLLKESVPTAQLGAKGLRREG